MYIYILSGSDLTPCWFLTLTQTEADGRLFFGNARRAPRGRDSRGSVSLVLSDKFLSFTFPPDGIRPEPTLCLLLHGRHSVGLVTLIPQCFLEGRESPKWGCRVLIPHEEVNEPNGEDPREVRFDWTVP